MKKQIMQMNRKILSVAILGMLLVGCSKKDAPGEGKPVTASYNRLYVLNEGAQNENRSTLDFYDLDAGIYHKNVYDSVNRTALGDVGSDILVYGGKIYAVVNGSNKVEIMDAVTVQSLAQLTINNGRYITAYNGKVYVTAYGNNNIPNLTDADAAKGEVAEIDTATLKVERAVLVGRQPEGIAVTYGKLYVANSGGYSYASGDYEKTVSVINLDDFTVTQNINVGLNLSLLQPDGKGNIYVASVGNYTTVPGKLYIVNCTTNTVSDSFALAPSSLYIEGDSAYVITVDWTNMQYQYVLINTVTKNIVRTDFITDGSEKEITVPYGITVNRDNGDIYVSDAGDYQASGYIWCFDKTGKKKWKTTAGQIPGHFTWLKE